MGIIWIAVVFMGAIALLGAIMWSNAKNRTSPEKKAMTERATAERYAEGDTTERGG